jgi:uncharacterized tellurite resistance protein B-like protein
MIVRLAVALMAADGRITQSELSTAEHLDRLGVGPLSTLAKEEIDRAARQPIDLGDTCTGLAELSPEGGRIILSILAEIAAADGVVISTEREMLREIAGLLTLPAGSADDALASLDLRTEFASLAVQKLAQATAAFEFVLAAVEPEAHEWRAV